MTESRPPRWVAGFWKRIGAFAIDALVLVAIGYLLGLGFSQAFVELGASATIVGFLVAGIYFSLLNSRLGGGQTLGKRLVEIRVVTTNSQLLSPVRAVARYCVLALPFFLNTTRFPNEVVFSVWIFPITLIMFGGALALVYLYLFNWKTRQSLHDLAVGSVVVKSGSEPGDLPSFWKPHWIVVGGVMLASLLIPAAALVSMDEATLRRLVTAEQALTDHPKVEHAVVRFGESGFTSDSNEETDRRQYIAAQAFLNEPTVDDEALARNIMSALIDVQTGSEAIDRVVVTLSYGYSIGIWSHWRTRTFRFNPDG